MNRQARRARRRSICWPLDEALDRLAVLDARQAKIVELRFFGGLTIDEAAQTLGISPATLKRDWTLARAWLRREVREGTDIDE